MVASRATASGDVNAALMLLVKQMGASMVKQMAKQDPAKLSTGLDWFEIALHNINGPMTSGEFKEWASK